jgi:LysM repeat protein
MSRHPGRHVKVTTSGYDARHAKPGMPGPAALIGTAAKAVPASLVAGAAGSALVLSGTASASTSAVPAGLVNASLVSSGAADLAAAKAALPRIAVTRTHHPARRSSYTVAPGDTLSRISTRFCHTPADYLSLAGASGITNPDVIYPGQRIKLDCHAAPALLPAPVSHAPSRPAHSRAAGRHAGARSDSDSRPPSAPARHRAPGRHARTHPARPQGGGFSTAGMAAFESCVISRESGGNPRAVNPASGAGGLFQFLPSTWAGLGFAADYPGGAQTAPVGVQEAAFAKLYAEAGTSPWRPYDGC